MFNFITKAIRAYTTAIAKPTIYPRVQALLKQGNFKTITFDSIKFAVDTCIEYHVKNLVKGGVLDWGNVFNFDMESHIAVRGIVAALKGELISSTDEFVKSFATISQAQREALEKATPPPSLNNFNPQGAYTNLANGENYTRGGAGDYSHYDPTQAKDPSHTPQTPSNLSDRIFGREGRFLGGGMRYNDTPISLHTSDSFSLTSFNQTQSNIAMYQLQLHNFQTRIFPTIENTLTELSVYFVITYTEKIGNKSRIGKWFKRLFLGREYELTTQDNKNRQDFIKQLTIQEANYYLMRIDKNMYHLQLTSHLARYNYGEDKGVLDKKMRYYLNMEDFVQTDVKPQAAANQAIMAQETKDLLHYMKNPSLVRAEIAKQESIIAQYKDNPFEMGILFALRAIDSKTEQLEENKQLDLENKLIAYIQESIIPFIKHFGEYCVFRYLDVCIRSVGFFHICSFWEFPAYIFSTAISDKAKLETHTPFYDQNNQEYINTGNALVLDYKIKHPNYKELSPTLETFLSLAHTTDILAQIDTLQESSPLYIAHAQLEDYQALLEYITDPETLAQYKELYGENLEYTSSFE